ncbi:MAG: hypothetical protein MUF23_05025 [Pirellula sp.]|jgi:hypothetical protein|nr:hypothetical protein [Pirellula sp.]
MIALGFWVYHHKSKDAKINCLLLYVYNGIQTYNEALKKPLPNRTKRLAFNFSAAREQSWRVAIHSYLSSSSFGGEYDPNEPYDSTRNLAAAFSVPRKDDPLSARRFDPGAYFRLDFEKDALGMRYTEVLRIAGSGTLGDGFDGRNEIPDGNSNTILLVYAPDCEILWTKACDLDVDEAGDCGLTAARWLRESERYALFADGSIWQLSRSTTLEDFRAMCTIAGGEIVDMSAHRRIP